MKQGWEIKKIKDICEKASSNIAQNKITSLDGDYPVYGASGFVQNVDFYHRDTEYIGIVKDGSGVGRVNIYPAYSSLLGTLQYILPKKGHSLYFVAYALKSLNLARYAAGAAIPHIYFKDYGEATISVPSLAEQERIVEVLDREFEKIDAMKANAVQNLRHAKDLLIQSQNAAFDSEDIRPLDSVVSIINGYAFKSEDFNKTNPIKAVKITNVGVGVFVETDDTNLPQKLQSEKQDYVVHTGDIVFALTRTIIADGLKVAIVPETYNCALLNQRVASLRIDDAIQRDYLYNYFQSTKVRRYVLNRVNVLMQPNLSIKDLKAMPIPYCGKIEMEKIVARLNKLKAHCKTLEENYTKTIALCDDMKKALLRKAFNGEL